MKKLLSSSDLLLLITTLIWGWTFIIVKWSVAVIDPYFFIFCRFLLALIPLVIIFHSRLKANWRTCLKSGIILGLLLGFTFIFQTLGLKYTSASASGFITGLNVVLVAVIAASLQRRFPRLIVLSGIVAASIGLLLISIKGSLIFAFGDLLTFICAMICAFHVVYTERLGTGVSAAVLTIIQLATVTVLAGLFFLIFGAKPVRIFDFSWLQWSAIGYCGLLATAVGFLFQTKAQQKTPTFRAAVLLATEPLFAGIFAIGLRFDPFDWKIVIGGTLIIAGMILASWDTKDGKEDRGQKSEVKNAT